MIDQNNYLYDVYSKTRQGAIKPEYFQKGIDKYSKKKVAAYGFSKEKSEYIIIFEDGSEQIIIPYNLESPVSKTRSHWWSE